MEKRILSGPKPTQPLGNGSIGQHFFNELKKFENLSACMTDLELGRSISYRELLKTTCRLATCLTRNGFGVCTMLSVFSENSIYYMQPVLAAWYVGITVAPVNPNYTDREIIHVFMISKPQIVFCSKRSLPKIVKLKQKLPFIKKIITLDGCTDTEHSETLNNFIERFSNENCSLEMYALSELDRNKHVSLVLCSSGTTGFPKGVMLTEKNMMIRYNQFVDPQCMFGRDLRPGDAVINYLPFFHGYGFSILLGYLIMGLHVFIMESYKEDLLLKFLEKFQVKSLCVVPSILISLAKKETLNDRSLSKLNEVVYGAAPTSKQIVVQAKQRFQIQEMRSGYGLTEGTIVSISTPLGCVKYSSVGKLLPFVDAKIVDIVTQEPLGPNRTGELCIKGDTVMKGYMGNAKATEDTIDRDGWLHTGDMAYYDTEEYFYIVDRLKELIKYKGFQVAPAELEALLLEYPGIKEVAVVGKPDLLTGELPTAFIVTDVGANISEKGVQDYVKANASREKQLRGGIFFVDYIPKNATGKISRKDLRKMLATTSKL
uniref:Luciferin 4-monooxygenase n=2 Tax=Photinus pyralis TaxID=7054 RepID=A0A1Y1N1H7_PHOPY